MPSHRSVSSIQMSCMRARGQYVNGVIAMLFLQEKNFRPSLLSLLRKLSSSAVCTQPCAHAHGQTRVWRRDPIIAEHNGCSVAA
jgi:hypothetical protein